MDLIKNNLTFYEDQLWQIIRMHAFETKITIDVSPSYGVLFYHVTLRIGKQIYHTSGVNLWKRYRYCIRKLMHVYGDNLYKYGAPTINAPKERYRILVKPFDGIVITQPSFKMLNTRIHVDCEKQLIYYYIPIY